MEYRIFDDMTQCTEQAVKTLLPLVPHFRQEQALRYKYVSGQFCCLKAWEMLQNISPTIAHHRPLSPTIAYNKHGKPSIEGAPEFSISHCKVAIAVAINNTPVGIDIESIRHADDSLIARTMNENEQAMIHAAADPARMFTRLWTMKEAYLKYLGTGIVDDLTTALDTATPARFVVEERELYIFSIYC